MQCDPSLEKMLIERVKYGDAAALESLIRVHQPMLLAMAKRLKCMRISCEELVQAGSLGFIQAVQRYDPEQEARLMTYAFPWILGEMRRALKSFETDRVSLDGPAGYGESRALCDILQSGESIDIGRIDLHLAIQRLRSEEQLLICLRYFQDQTQKETAVLLGKSQTQISRMERRALDALRALLTQ